MGFTYLKKLKMNQSWGCYEVSNLYTPSQNWVSKLVILLHFMATNMYQEADVLSHKNNALCEKDGRNCYTV